MFVVRVCMFGVWRLGGYLLGPWLLPTLAQGTSQTPGYVIYIVGAVGAAAHCSLCCFLCLSRQFGGFLVFLAFSAPFFRIYFLWLLKPAWFWWCGGRTAERGLSRVGYVARNVAEDLLYFLFFLLLQLATGS